MKKYARIFVVALISISFNNLYSQSPYELKYKYDIPTFQTGISLFSLGIYLGDRIEPFTSDELDNLSRESVNRMDRFATYNWSPAAAQLSDVFLLSYTFLPFFLNVDNKTRGDRYIINTLYMQTFLLTNTGTMITKSIVQRPRPYVHNPDVSHERKMNRTSKRSFFSGHTSSTFASAWFLASVYEKYHPNSKSKDWVWASSMTSASLVAYLRVKAGKHYLTDVLAGALFGTLVCYLVLESHELDNLGQVNSNYPNNDAIGFNLQIIF